jgi:dehydrogenase/reductase SDR family protein 12
VDTPGVESAYGESKRYLEPLRTLWEGSEGIMWLCVAPAEQLEGGAFYLDRSPQVRTV